MNENFCMQSFYVHFFTIQPNMDGLGLDEGKNRFPGIEKWSFSNGLKPIINWLADSNRDDSSHHCGKKS